jgi:hypothetical protein
MAATEDLTMAILITEHKMAEQVGLSMDDLAKLRVELYEPEHWVMSRGRVAYTEAGVEEIMRRVKAESGKVKEQDGLKNAADGQDGAGQWTEQKKGGAEAVVLPATSSKPMTCCLVVTRICPNPIWVEAVKKNGGERVLCRVTWNRRLRRGQVLDGCTHERDRYVYNRKIVR